MTASQQRKLQRAVHLTASTLLLAYVYAPVDDRLQNLVRAVVFPLLLLTGLAMWQAPRIRRVLKRVRAARTTA
jgi:hypothetical protein